jgi:hypothetical protein
MAGMRFVAPSLLLLAACSSASSPDALAPPFTACRSTLYLAGQSEPGNRIEYAYDEDGWTRIARAHFDGDGVVDLETRMRYRDDQHWEQLQKLAPTGSGELVVFHEERWSWEGEQLVEYTIDEDGVGGVDAAWTYVYADGRISETQYDEGGDGTVESVWVWRYDEEGRHIAYDVWSGGVKYSDVHVYAYDERDRLIALDIDGDGDGEFDRHHDFDFDAHGFRSLDRETYLDDSGYVHEQTWENAADRVLRRDLRDLTHGELTGHRWIEYDYDCE